MTPLVTAEFPLVPNPTPGHREDAPVTVPLLLSVPHLPPESCPRGPTEGPVPTGGDLGRGGTPGHPSQGEVPTDPPTYPRESGQVIFVADGTFGVVEQVP